MYRYQARLVFKQYIPKKLELGMLFVIEVEGKPQLVEINRVLASLEETVNEFGYPVEMYIVEEDHYDDVIAYPQDLGWFNEDPEEETLKPFSLKEANFILLEYDGLLEIVIHEAPFDDNEFIIPKYVDQKVIINYIKDDEEV